MKGKEEQHNITINSRFSILYPISVDAIATALTPLYGMLTYEILITK